MTSAALLQLPVPMLHRHTEFDIADSLAEHLDTRHGNPTTGADQLHWHFVLPQDLNGEHDSDEKAPAAQVSCTCLAGISAGTSLIGASARLLAVSPFDCLAYSSLALTSGAEQTANRASQQTHSYSALSPALRACALLCVRRC